MIFYKRQLMDYSNQPDPHKQTEFAQKVLIWGAQFRGEI
jgi:hypothetical protein